MNGAVAAAEHFDNTVNGFNTKKIMILRVLRGKSCSVAIETLVNA